MAKKKTTWSRDEQAAYERIVERDKQAAALIAAKRELIKVDKDNREGRVNITLTWLLAGSVLILSSGFAFFLAGFSAWTN